MAEGDTTVDVEALETELETLRPLADKVKLLEADISKGAESIKSLVSVRDALQVKVKTGEQQIADLTKQAADLGTVKEAHTKLSASFIQRIQSNLKAHKLTDDLLKDKTLDQLLAMEDALGAVKPADGTVTQKGLGLGGGAGTPSGSVPGFSLDDDMKIIQKAKERAGIK